MGQKAHPPGDGWRAYDPGALAAGVQLEKCGAMQYQIVPPAEALNSERVLRAGFSFTQFVTLLFVTVCERFVTQKLASCAFAGVITPTAKTTAANKKAARRR